MTTIYTDYRGSMTTETSWEPGASDPEDPGRINAMTSTAPRIALFDDEDALPSWALAERRRKPVPHYYVVAWTAHADDAARWVALGVRP